MFKKYSVFSDGIISDSNGYYLKNININNVKQLRINKFLIPTSFNTISASRGNNTLNIAGSTITIPDGQYSIAQLCNYLSPVLVALDATFTITYSSINKFVTIARTTNFTFNLDLSKAAKLLGFASTGSLTGAATYTSTQAYNPMDLNAIIFSCDKFKFNVCSESNRQYENFITFIPVYNLPDNLIIYEPKYPIQFSYESGTVINNLYVNFYFVDGTVIDFKGVPFAFELEFN